MNFVRPTRRRAIASLAAPLLFYGGAALAFLAWAAPLAGSHLHAVMLTGLGLFALWRYGWQVLNYARAWTYSTLHYPRLARQAQSMAHRAPQRIFVVVASYLEEPWVSVEAFQALMANLAQLPCRATVVVAAGSDQDEAVIASAWRTHPAHAQVELVFQRQSKGKRIALGHALRAVARRFRDEPDSVTVFMDGDSWLEPGALARCLPFFAAFQDLGAVTTNEVGFIPHGRPWLRDWFALKFGQRHVLFQSHSLSHKVLTLTGRFSVFRTSVVVGEDFIRRIENDTVEHWMHGRFRFLMGDDKSSWFHLLEQGWKMLYLPDVTCVSLESRDADFIESSLSLPYRWFGNTLRNNPRALALGPRRTGWFIWFALLDQRLSMWTSLVGLAGAAALAATKSFLYLPLYVAWAVLVRCGQIAVIAWHGHAVSLRSIPLMLYTQWVGALVKIHAWHHLADQRWGKGTARQSVGARGGQGAMARWLPKGAMVLSYLAFGAAVLLAHSVLRLPNLHLFAAEAQPRAAASAAAGVVPDDGRDDGPAIQALIDRAGGAPVRIELPPGQIDLFTPVAIRRDGVVLTGAGADRTRIVSHLALPAEAVLRVAGEAGDVVGRLAQPLSAEATTLRLDKATDLRAGDFLWLKQPNDDALFDALGSRQWRRTYPQLRQAMLRVTGSGPNGIEVEAPAGIAFEAGKTQVWKAAPVRGVRLADFGIEQRVAGRDIAQTRLRYENLAPEAALDAIALDWTADAVVERVAVRAAGRHPVSFEHSYGFALRECRIEDAWNKGEGGHGYLRIARSFRGEVSDCRIAGIRHVALQWSSAFNRLQRLDTAVDLNFHGGYSHHNTADDIASAIPPGHPWPAVFTTPPGAHWAPPDGPGNRATVRTASTAPAARAASPAH